MPGKRKSILGSARIAGNVTTKGLGTHASIKAGSFLRAVCPSHDVTLSSCLSLGNFINLSAFHWGALPFQTHPTVESRLFFRPFTSLALEFSSGTS